MNSGPHQVTGDHPPFQVRPVIASEWASFRDIRLRALASSPEAFSSTWSHESEFPESTWRERAVPSSSRQMWSARCGADWIGLVGAVREAAGQVQLVSMWVHPSWRRQGVARALIAAVVAWHRLAGSSGIYLWVAVDNLAARNCYEVDGFRPTGARLPLPSDPTRQRLEMRLGSDSA
ncbi:MAG TPA: GNAT family N-acetyltransferase [Candidatus Dormibacteraeota bacterium]|nr:GNAT family N-acetyltransferase [Candidatus Dormibacteraeota bacterium]